MVPILLLAAAVVSTPAAAQVFTPTFMAPRASSDVGIYVSDGPGDLAIEGIWRGTLGSGANLGLRGGFADLGDGSLLLGAEYRNPLRLTGTAPIDLALTLGAQAVIGDSDGLGGQVGLSLGYTFTSPELTFTPYLHPRLAIVDPPGEGEDGGVDALADIGFDLGFAPNLSLRLGVSLGDGADWGIGLAWRTR